MDRRVKYQVKHESEGLCILCSRKIFKWKRCRTHYIAARKRNDARKGKK